MQNFIQPGRTLTVTAPGTIASGDVLVVGSIVGIAATDAASGADVEVDTEGVFSIPKVTTDVVSQGAPLYWNASAGKATITAGTGSKPLIGYATKAAGNGVTVVEAKLIQSLQTGPAV
jgi:predicted RecA/RadA family phage recombinase